MRTRFMLVAGLAVLVSACTIDAPTFVELDAGGAVDGRTDAGGGDALSPDAVAVDGALADAAEIDAMPIDAMPIDAMPIDAMPIDAMPIDAAPIDAMPIDAAPIDAMPVTLTVRRAGSGAGMVAWDGSECGIGCSMGTTSHQPGTFVTIVATPLNGSDSFFASWSGACSGWARTCVVEMTNDLEVTANFASQDANLVFVSSQTYRADLGGALAYDAQCNVLATTAGINNAAGNAYVALMSDDSTRVEVRLAGARGFRRMDGLPFADEVSTLFHYDAKIFYPLVLDENGVDPGAVSFFTGTDRDGDVHPRNCQGWTTLSNEPYSPWGAFGGRTRSGPLNEWIGGSFLSCAATERIVCVGRSKSIAVQPPPAPDSAKLTYLTNTPFVPGGMTPDQACDASKPSTAGSVRAVIATTTASAANRLNTNSIYARPDGVILGLGSQLLAGTQASGVWQRGDGSYTAGMFRSGAGSITQLGTQTCLDWTSSSGTLSAWVSMGAHLPEWWSSGGAGDYPCSSGFSLLCVEQ